MAIGNKKTIFERDEERVDNWSKLTRAPLSDETKEAALFLVADGMLLTGLVERGVIPSYWHLYEEAERDTKFGEKLKQAQARGARTLLNRAQAHAVEMVNSGDDVQVRAADALMRVTQTFAEKVAPKDFGPLVKLAGDTDAPLQLNVVNYCLPQPAAIPLEAIAVPVAIAHDNASTRAGENPEDQP